MSSAHPMPRLHVVLVEPEIPNNTGNIGRTCIAAGCALHLIHPLGFDTSDKALKRAGMDYWPRVNCTEHPSWSAYRERFLPSDRKLPQPAHGHWFFTSHASRCLWDVAFRPGDHLVFGKESSGLGKAIIGDHPERCVTVPMAAAERSLNLASCVAIVAYEALRQLHARGKLALIEDARLANIASTDDSAKSPP